ncbi:LuxR family transcriptional regulator [Yersinia massiliensis]|jgi:LuxR family quorum-sensing system transcriptional regulator ExpR|uniref:LuxR family transcriptional regulator n=3 Tax=Yersinia TaxID=629 RepID=A0A0T9P8Q4_9GAMM|nr:MULTISPECIES: LuxR family transcriptional regulator [Yersinia]HEI6966393.1 LuxR family transcriptional regulator [Yersinia enterocolitica]ATM85461.1 LuxR family transcriptional regulator [Yersinia frederiksenii]AVX38633.1 LuxR family transcriptional regulator [Yersinia massiliensis]MCB5308940.1 LuxR family transcriptional regulator [Yersinia massiliensis]MCB5316049.1 LuxR family transcriptional regulator [Yersinia massiliensis]
MIIDYFDNESINEDIKNYIQRRIKTYGDLRYSYLVMNKKTPLHPAIISNYPLDWVKKYRQNSYHLIDPVILTAKDNVAPFAWDDNSVINKKSTDSAVFNLAREYNIINGYTFVLHDNNNNMATLNISNGSDDSISFDESIETHKEKIQMLLILTHDKMLGLYRQDFNANNELQRSGKPREIFSPRENEILYWASVGKTYSEIAIILEIKRSTVKFHIGNVVRKLGVLNAKHAIRLGIELKLIKPI